ncbi:MAG: threonine ammonia-lyase [Solirubrobacterales bacterium]
MHDPATIGAEQIARAREAGAGHVRNTPVLTSRTIGERCGGEVVLKAENLQRTGSFKLRGALAKLAALGDACRAGVVTASAGNHAQSLAYAARAYGVPCEVFMPSDASTAKTDSAAALGATVNHVEGGFDECLEAAEERARDGGLAFVHAFDDSDVVAGQATLGLELLEGIPRLARVVVPVGGGGLASGVAIAVKSARPDVDVVGVQVEGCAPFPASLERGEPVPASSALTIADGIAVKRPGGLTLPLIREWLDGVAVVSEDSVAEAMIALMERAKLVVEGAGAVGVAALLDGRVDPAADGVTAVVLSGGNVDAGLLATVARRHETESGRRFVILTRISDRPGGLAALLTRVAAAGANLVEVSHVREGLDLHVRETAVELVLETRGRDHSDEIVRTLEEAGYSTGVVRTEPGNPRPA